MTETGRLSEGAPTGINGIHGAAGAGGERYREATGRQDGRQTMGHSDGRMPERRTDSSTEKSEKKKKKNKKVQVQKRATAGESIENRPDEVATREPFGHWEMDTVKGKQGVTKSCMLVLTERKTRDEIIFKLKDQKAESVVDALDRLERKWGDMFSKVFRSITVDNGVEFSDCKGMERSALTPGEKRTYLFYCHPYSSWERGTNENTNKLIRRHIPKGEDFDEKQDRDIEFIENWINTYPRGIFGFRTSEELFKEELEKNHGIIFFSKTCRKTIDKIYRVIATKKYLYKEL